MKFQALLLSLVILISLVLSSGTKLLTPVNSEELKSNNSFSIFIKDLHSAFLEKIKLAGQDLENFQSAFSEKIKLVDQNFASAAGNLNQNLNRNLVAIKEILSSEFNNENDKFDKSYHSYPSTSALISETKINSPEIFPCKPDKSGFTGFTSKAILIKYMNSSTGSGQVIFELNPEKRWPIASLSKLMTAIVSIEKMDLDKKIVMTEKAVATEGTAGDFKVGEVFKLRDLIKAMLISSSNDAAVAITETFGEPRNSTELSLRGERDFINEMQKKAAEIKMFSTTYLEPTGLSFINQSTATDLAKLISYIYFEHPEILEISRQKEAEILELKTGKVRKILTVNKFAGEPNFIGGKTGYIDEAGRNLVGLFDIDGKTVLTIILGADDSFKETEKLKGLVYFCELKAKQK